MLAAVAAAAKVDGVPGEEPPSRESFDVDEPSRAQLEIDLCIDSDKEAVVVSVSEAAVRVQSTWRARVAWRFLSKSGLGVEAFASALAAGRAAAPVSAAELERRRLKVAEELARHIAGRDFSEAKTAQLEVDALTRARDVIASLTPALHGALLVESGAAQLELQHKSSLTKGGKAKDYGRLEALDARAARADLARMQACPSAAEVEAELRKQEKDMEVAIATRDFGRCAELEKTVALLRGRSKCHPDADDVDMGVVDKRSLVSTIEELETALQASLESRDFAKCTKLEQRLTKKRGMLQDLLTDPEPRIVVARAGRATAVATNDWRAAGAAQAEIKKWERRAAMVKAASKNPLAPPSVRKTASGQPMRALSGLHASGSIASPPVSPPKKAPVVVVAAPRVAAATPKVATVAASAKKKKTKKMKTVAGLRPEAAVVVAPTETIAQVCVTMASKRVDCVLVCDVKGALLGIATDNDVARRALNAGLDVATTRIDVIMTASPKCVKAGDPALEALSTMVANKFRHLPVLDDEGIVGVLSVYKCLYEAIERVEGMMESNAKASEAMLDSIKGKGSTKKLSKSKKQLVDSLVEALSGKSAKKLKALFDDSSPERRSEAQLAVSATVLDAAKRIAITRRAVLIVDDQGALLGIITPKDLVNRVIAKGLDPADTLATEVMTPKPDTISSDATMLKALQEMHDNKYLHLPVVSASTTLGVVDVMELVYATMGEAGGEGWSTLLAGGDDEEDEEEDEDDSDDDSDSDDEDGSLRSGSLRTASSSVVKKRRKKKESGSTVAKLRPKEALVFASSACIFEVCHAMTANRTDCALLTSDGKICGIVTETDVARKAVAKGLDPATVAVSVIMTADPRCVQPLDSAVEALEIMVKNHFRHLPVVLSDSYAILAIHKCLHAAIANIERLVAAGADQSSALLKELVVAKPSKKKQQLSAVLGTLLSALAGPSAKTLGSLLEGKPERAKECLLDSECLVLEAALVIESTRRAVIATTAEGDIAGILTPKDVLNRVVSKGLNAATTCISLVMTPQPETISSDATLLEALHRMHDQRFLHLPVVSSKDKTVLLGVVDVMELVYATMGDGDGEGWSTLMAAQNDDADSVVSESSRGGKKQFQRRPDYDDLASVASNDLRAFDDCVTFAFKVTDLEGCTHRIVSAEDDLEQLRAHVATKLGKSGLALTYKDEDGDEVLISDDESLTAAVNLARTTGSTLKIMTRKDTKKKKKTPKGPSTGLIAAASVGAAVIAALLIFSQRK